MSHQFKRLTTYTNIITYCFRHKRQHYTFDWFVNNTIPGVNVSATLLTYILKFTRPMLFHILKWKILLPGLVTLYSDGVLKN